MPIRPEHRWLYPIDWPQLSAAIRSGRAKGRCEGCGRPHGNQVRHTGDGRWWDEDRATWRNGSGRVLKRAPVSGSAERVTFHDRDEHGRRRRLTYRMRKAVGDLFAGIYSRHV